MGLRMLLGTVGCSVALLLACSQSEPSERAPPTAPLGTISGHPPATEPSRAPPLPSPPQAHAASVVEPAQLTASAAACARARAALDAALQAAQHCSLASSHTPCSGRVQDLCGCAAPIDEPLLPEARAAIEAARADAAASCAAPCAGVRCRPRADAECRTDGSSAYGRCVALP
jgi:hypothetical protein